MASHPCAFPATLPPTDSDQPLFSIEDAIKHTSKRRRLDDRNSYVRSTTQPENGGPILASKLESLGRKRTLAQMTGDAYLQTPGMFPPAWTKVHYLEGGSLLQTVDSPARTNASAINVRAPHQYGPLPVFHSLEEAQKADATYRAYAPTNRAIPKDEDGPLYVAQLYEAITDVDQCYRPTAKATDNRDWFLEGDYDEVELARKTWQIWEDARDFYRRGCPNGKFGNRAWDDRKGKYNAKHDDDFNTFWLKVCMVCRENKKVVNDLMNDRHNSLYTLLTAPAIVGKLKASCIKAYSNRADKLTKARNALQQNNTATASTTAVPAAPPTNVFASLTQPGPSQNPLLFTAATIPHTTITTNQTAAQLQVPPNVQTMVPLASAAPLGIPQPVQHPPIPQPAQQPPILQPAQQPPIHQHHGHPSHTHLLGGAHIPNPGHQLPSPLDSVASHSNHSRAPSAIDDLFGQDGSAEAFLQHDDMATLHDDTQESGLTQPDSQLGPAFHMPGDPATNATPGGETASTTENAANEDIFLRYFFHGLGDETQGEFSALDNLGVAIGFWQIDLNGQLDHFLY